MRRSLRGLAHFEPPVGRRMAIAWPEARPHTSWRIRRCCLCADGPVHCRGNGSSPSSHAAHPSSVVVQLRRSSRAASGERPRRAEAWRGACPRAADSRSHRRHPDRHADHHQILGTHPRCTPGVMPGVHRMLLSSCNSCTCTDCSDKPNPWRIRNLHSFPFRSDGLPFLFSFFVCSNRANHLIASVPWYRVKRCNR